MKSWGTLPAERYLALAATGALVLAVHALTLLISPPLWQDEVQIVDLGRQTLHPGGQAWSLSWIAAGRPIAFINYLGPVIQELAYRLTAPSASGPRLSTILGALLAAGFVYAWLRARGVSWRLAWLGAVLLLLDPQFVASYRGARVDSWVFALMFMACYFARRGATDGAPPAGSRPYAWRFFVGAGVIAGIAFFVWPSSFYLYPLLAAELVDGASGVARGALVRRFGLVMLGGLGGMLACLLPIAGRIASEWGDIFISKDAYLYRGSMARRVLSGLLALPAASKLSPLLPLFALAAVFFRRNRALAVAAAATVAVMLPTQIYAGRVVYLLPYTMALTIHAAQELTAGGQRTSRWLRAGALAAALLWTVGLSLIGRPANAWMGRRTRDPALLSAALVTAGAADHRKIYLGAWEFYYAGRAVGWEMFVPYGAFSPEETARLYRGLDAALVRSDADPTVTQALLAAGLHPSKELQVGPGTTIDATSMRSTGYGAYVFYTRNDLR